MKVSRRFGGTCQIHLQRRRVSQETQEAGGALLVSHLDYSSIWKIEAIFSSETSIDFHGTTWRLYLRRQKSSSDELLIYIAQRIGEQWSI
jgi:hypothetical protein